jgi:hypothetical protein
MAIALPNTTTTANMVVRKGQPCGLPELDRRSSTLTLEGLAVVRQPRLGRVDILYQPPGFRYLSNRAGNDRFEVVFTGHTSLRAPYTIRSRVNVRVTE